MKPTQANTPINLIKVANRQKVLVWSILLSILSGAVLVLSAGRATTSGFIFIPVMAIICILLFQLLALIQAFRLSAAMRSNYVMPILLIFGIFIPLLGLIMLLLINSKANTMLKAAGAKIGIMGVPKSEYPKMMKENCPDCGYSREGLEPLQTCPECGRMPQIR